MCAFLKVFALLACVLSASSAERAVVRETSTAKSIGIHASEPSVAAKAEEKKLDETEVEKLVKDAGLTDADLLANAKDIQAATAQGTATAKPQEAEPDAAQLEKMIKDAGLTDADVAAGMKDAKAIAKAKAEAKPAPKAEVKDDKPDAKQLEKMIQDAGLTDADVAAGLEAKSSNTPASKAQASPKGPAKTAAVQNATAAGKAGQAQKKDAKLQAKAVGSAIKARNVSQVAGDMDKKSAKAKGLAVSAEKSMDKKMQRQVKKKAGKGARLDLSDDDMPTIGVLGTADASNIKEQIYESKLVYGFMISVIVFTVWWTNGTPSKWSSAIRWEVRSAYVPGVMKQPADVFEEEYSSKRSKKGISKQREMSSDFDDLLG